MKEKFVKYFMKIAEETADLSNAIRNKVGAIIVKDGCILGNGYNGTPAGWDNACENMDYLSDYEQIVYDSNNNALHPMTLERYDIMYPLVDKQGRRYKLVTKPEVIHAEQNCLGKAAQSTYSTTGATMFCTLQPCMDCAKSILQSGITTVYYRDVYRDDSGVKFLEKGNVNVIRYVSGDAG